jgi:hypothetical protein
MGWFKKKRDPISERARMLNQQIAALEEQIAQLAAQTHEASQGNSNGPHEEVSPPASEPAKPVRNVPPPETPPPRPPAATPTVKPSPQPRLRSTALPHGPTISAQPATPTASPTTPPHAPGTVPIQEPIFEEVGQNPFKSTGEAPAVVAPAPELGTRKNGLVSFWQRLTNHFRGPPTSNPKLVNYLAAGSIQGLRPLRYEKRVARNRFIVLVILLALVLWGLVAVFMKR